MLIQLSHLKALKYPRVAKKFSLPVPQDVIELARKGATLLTFRPLVDAKPNLRIRNITAVERFLWVRGDPIVFWGVETDSPLAPLILWDIAHVAEVGSTIRIMGDRSSESFLDRPYFRRALELVDQDASSRTFKKQASLPAEADKGLDSWTFGIPVGPEDATLLNQTVQRILDLDVPTKEILLCGRPAENFAFWDKVRIVGEDITAPPVRICAKKNRLAQEASYPNLCIIHDRVFLPLNFHEAVKRFGDLYPLTTLQSVFFDDKYNFIPRRYSDAGVTYKAKAATSKGLFRDNDASCPSIFANGVLPMTELYGFYAANARRYSQNIYPTGSAYLCKRSIWLENPQNENLHWIEFEDLEHAFRACEAGVPSRVNPHTLTQSLIARPLLSRVTGNFIESTDGVAKIKRPWTEPLPLPRKPAIKATYETALGNLQRFADKYVPKPLAISVDCAAVLRPRERMRVIGKILSRTQVRANDKDIREFVRDFEKLVVMDQLPYSQIEHTCNLLGLERAGNMHSLLVDCDALIHQVASRPRGDMFCGSLRDYLQKRTALLLIGTMVSGLYLWLQRKEIIYIKGGPLAYITALLHSTPFAERPTA